MLKLADAEQRERRRLYWVRYRAANREKLRTYNRELARKRAHLRATLEAKARRRAYLDANKDKQRQQRRRYNERHPERRRESSARAKAKNPELYRMHAIRARHVSRARSSRAVVERVSREAIWNRDHKACHLCLAPIAREHLSLDHLIPIVRGGAFAAWNLMAAHSVCNKKRRSKAILPLEDRAAAETYIASHRQRIETAA